MSETQEFHVLAIERAVNERLGGDATISELVRLLIAMGWTPPETPQRLQPHEIGDPVPEPNLYLAALDDVAEAVRARQREWADETDAGSGWVRSALHGVQGIIAELRRKRSERG